jgi:hypothetical protein
MHDVIPALEMLLKANFNLLAHVSPLGYGNYELIAVRVLARAEWEAQLRQLKCWPYIGANPLRTAEDWETEHGFLFFVPMDNARGGFASMT